MKTCVCEGVCVCVCVHWLWLNMFCGINSDHGWASFLCNQTNWLTSRWGSGLNSSYDFHCAGFYPPVSQEQKNEKQELAVTGGRIPVLGVLPAFSCLGRFLPRWGEGTQMTTGQIHSQHRQVGHCSYAGYSITPVTQNLLRWKPQKGQGHLRLPHSPENHVKWRVLSPTSDRGDR